MATEKIFARSPYYVAYKDNVNQVDKVKVNVWAYEGAKTTDRPTNPTYTLEKTSSVNEGGYNWWTFEVAELLKDYLPKVGNPALYPPTAMWGAIQVVVDYTSGSTTTGSIEDFAVFDGYIKYGEGSQSMTSSYSGAAPIPYSFVRPISSEIFTADNNTTPTFVASDYLSTFIPVYVDDTGAPKTIIYTAANSAATNSQTLTAGSNSSQIIQYALADNAFVSFYNGLKKAELQNQLVTAYDITDCIPDFTNNNTGTKIWFLNRFGAIDKVTFMGLKTDSYETSKNEYRANIVGAKANGSWGYETYQRQKSILNKKGKAKFSLNTGWIAENYNDKIEDLLLAEQVWINPSGNTSYPVNIMTSNIQEKTDANEKIVNYAIEFEYANDIQNNIR
jgi:hypothetical protein